MSEICECFKVLVSPFQTSEKIDPRLITKYSGKKLFVSLKNINEEKIKTIHKVCHSNKNIKFK